MIFAENREQKIQEIYLIGASAMLLADWLSDADNLKVLRRLKEVVPEIKGVGTIAYQASKVLSACDKYTRDIEGGRRMGRKGRDGTPASNEALEQFAASSLYLERWLRIIFEVPESKHEALDRKIQQVIEILQGKRKDNLTVLLEWLENQPYQISSETVRNKVIQLKNA